jgi:hypothetical protein
MLTGLNNQGNMSPKMYSYLKSFLVLMVIMFIYAALFWRFRYLVIFSEARDQHDALMVDKFRPTSILVSKSKMPPQLPIPQLEVQIDADASQVADIFVTAPSPPQTSSQSFQSNITNTINSDLSHHRYPVILPKLSAILEANSRREGGSGDRDLSNSDTSHLGNGSYPNEKPGLFPTSQQENVAIVVEKQPGSHYLEALRHSYPKAFIILAISGKGEFSPNLTIRGPSDQQCNPDGTITIESMTPWIKEQEIDVKAPDVFSCDLYAGIYLAMQRESTSVILISTFSDLSLSENRSSSSTKALINEMKSVHLRLFVVDGGSVLPLSELSNYANDSGGTSVIDGPYYGSPEWESYTHLLREN